MLTLKGCQNSHFTKRTRRAGRKVLSWMWQNKPRHPRETPCQPLMKFWILPQFQYTLRKYFIRLGRLWLVIKLNARQTKRTVLLCQRRSCIFRGLSKYCKPSPSHWQGELPLNSPPIFPESSTLVRLIRRCGSNRHPQSAATWTLRSGLCPSSACERKCSTAGATPDCSCQCDMWTEGPPLSGHLLVQWWGNLPCRPHFCPAGTQSCSSEFTKKIGKASFRAA